MPSKSRSGACCWFSWIPGWGRSASKKVSPKPRRQNLLMRDRSQGDVESMKMNGPPHQNMSDVSDNVEEDEEDGKSQKGYLFIFHLVDKQ